MLETEVKEYAAFSTARSDSERESDARNYLQTVLKIVRPANAGID